MTIPLSSRRARMPLCPALQAWPDTAIEALALPNLEVLLLAGTELQDSFVAALASSASALKLRVLDLSRHDAMGDAALASLAACQSLEKVGLAAEHSVAPGAQALHAEGCWKHCRAEPAGLQSGHVPFEIHTFPGTSRPRPGPRPPPHANPSPAAPQLTLARQGKLTPSGLLALLRAVPILETVVAVRCRHLNRKALARISRELAAEGGRHTRLLLEREDAEAWWLQ